MIIETMKGNEIMKIKATLEKATEALNKIKAKGSVRGDMESGRVSISGVEANYTFDQDKEEMTIRITDTPFFVSESYVEDEIRKFFR